MRHKHEIILNLRRNLDQAFKELLEHHCTVAADSVFGSQPETAMMRHMMSSKRDDGSLYVILQWVFRDHWRTQVMTPGSTLYFNSYEITSHKYWLRGLIRRCR